MNPKLKDAIKAAFAKSGLGITSHENLQKLRREAINAYDIDFLKVQSDESLRPILDNLAHSKAQLRQDLFVLAQTNFKKNGFFVEFGATNGIKLSNTYMLEKQFGWHGILAEPAQMWHKALKENRIAHIETNCVWKETGQTLTFDQVYEGELSTISDFSHSDDHQESRKTKKTYDVTTISLLDLLQKHKAPQIIDYLSVDTEGSEFEILNAFDFSQYDIRLITVEHNYTENREHLYNLLNQNGFKRCFEEVSQFDDWYIKV